MRDRMPQGTYVFLIEIDAAGNCVRSALWSSVERSLWRRLCDAFRFAFSRKLPIGVTMGTPVIDTTFVKSGVTP